jgi:hypothetical protein
MVYTKKEMAAKRERYLVNNRQAAHKSREQKKTWVTGLLERVELSIANNAKLPYEIIQTMLELEGLRAIAVEHYRVCPNPSPELAAWFEKEVATSPLKAPLSTAFPKVPPACPVANRFPAVSPTLL